MTSILCERERDREREKKKEKEKEKERERERERHKGRGHLKDIEGCLGVKCPWFSPGVLGVAKAKSLLLHPTLMTSRVMASVRD